MRRSGKLVSEDSSSSAFRFRGRRTAGWGDDEVKPRLPSARLRGEKAPYVRTSLSPDRFLRHRDWLKRRKDPLARPQTGNEDDVIDISSDSDAEIDDAPPRGRPRQTTFLPHRDGQPKAAHKTTSVASGSGAARAKIDLTSDPEGSVTQRDTARPAQRHLNAMPPPLPSTSLQLPRWSSSNRRFAEAPINITQLNRGPAIKHKFCKPPWLRVAFCELWKVFPDARYELIRPSGDTGGSKECALACLLCGPQEEFPVGPGKALDTFRLHLRQVHFPLPDPLSQSGGGAPSSATMDSPPGSPVAATSSAGGAGKKQDEVERFLIQQGLPTDLVRVLRATGITDGARMRMLGLMSESALDKLEQRLAVEGLDFAACLLVREGLRRLAGNGES